MMGVTSALAGLQRGSPACTAAVLGPGERDAPLLDLLPDVGPAAARRVGTGIRSRIPRGHHDTNSRVRSTCLAMASATCRASGLSSTGRFWWVE